jgi:TPP-dependent pyruvate/acetoin dehydrogenase alpha subunit
MIAQLTCDESLELYYYLRLNRSLEELLVRLFRQNKVFGGIYGSLGQEAISVGAAYALGPGDWIAPMVRNMGALLVRGFRPRDLLAQHMARQAGPTQGKDSGCHFGDLHVRHVVAPISMLGDLIPVMTGVAMGARYLGQKIVALTWIGDGGSSTGAFHEGLNMAAAQKAPFVLVLENNQWAYATPVARQVPLRDLAERARAYGIAHHVVDGNDVAAVVSTVREAAAHARGGNGPVLIEAKTMRMLGHAQHDAAEYVPPEMLAYWKTRDPIHRFEAFLAEQKFADAQALQSIRERIEKELAEDLAFAENSPFPPPELASQGVYCESGCHTVRPQWQRDQNELLPPRSSVKAAWTVDDFGDLAGQPAPSNDPEARR